MRLLLDTHLLLWAADGSKRLPGAARALIDDDANTLLFSVASIWEVAIKQSRGRPDFDIDPGLLREGLLANRYEELPVLGRHAIAVRALPGLHADPFDRLLVAQAVADGLVLMTSDRVLGQYPGPVLPV